MLTPIDTPSKKPTVDIIFVHGLSGNAYKTWTSKSGCFWPMDLLPKTLASFRPRILTYIYGTTMGGDIVRHAKDLAEVVAAERKVGIARLILFIPPV